jgi:hypothetical protein
MSVTFATGADAKMFWNACALHESFAAHNPGHRITIADFGLHPRQIAFLEAIGAAAACPPALRGHHPWMCKTGLPEFAGLDVDRLAWVDADMVAVGPCADEAARIAADMAAQGARVAICEDAIGLTLAGFIQAFRARSVGPFEQMLKAHGIDLGRPYLNTGLFIIGDRSFWKAWRALTFATPVHLAFDQSSFNTLAHASGQSVYALDPASWNVHGQLIGTADLGATGRQPVRFLHATSMKCEHHQDRLVNVNLGRHGAQIVFKTFVRDDLRRHHLDALQAFISRHREQLVRHDLLRAVQQDPAQPVAGS